ncbi:MAG: hypothetical protein H0X30_24375 [Anaerolineae bacterium]|nr:hypothetical protein [Anaerolineae bacterium]
MGFNMEWVANEPILIATATGLIAADDFKMMFDTVAKMIDGLDGKIYRIADYTAADSSFMDIIKTVKVVSTQSAGSTADPRIQTVYVGTSQWISLARTALQQPQFGGIMVPTFHDLADALVFARKEIAKAQEQISA